MNVLPITDKVKFNGVINRVFEVFLHNLYIETMVLLL
jgi:hypothetical protein